MRGGWLRQSCRKYDGGLSHTSVRKVFPSRHLLNFPSTKLSGSAIMTSQVNGEHEWSAVRVRNTFLDYFKKNGHTFGP